MKNIDKKNKAAFEDIPKAEIQKGIINHKKAAYYFESIEKSQLKAAKSTFKTLWHTILAKNEAQKEDIKHQTARF